jgi:hypothetical protein
MKEKIVSLVCAAFIAGSTVFAEESTQQKNSVITFSNELGSDVVNVTKDKTTFAGFYDKVITDVTSEKVDATYLDFGFGAEYTFGNRGTLAAVVRNPANSDSFSYGFYGSLTPSEGLAA